MKVKKLMPHLSMPVKRENVAMGTMTAAHNEIAPATHCDIATRQCYPFASDSAE